MVPRRVAGVLLFACVYAAAALLSLELATLHRSASPAWPPTGIAVAVLVARGRWLWPGVYAGALVANLPTEGPAALLIAAGNSAEAWLAATLIGRWCGGTQAFATAPRVLRFAGVAVLATAVSATVGVAALLGAQSAVLAEAPAIWFTWWLGDLVGALVVAPLGILLLTRAWPAWRPEAVAAAATLAVLTGITFGQRAGLPISFVVLPALLWAAFRFGPFGSALATAVLAVPATMTTLRGSGPFAYASTNGGLLMVQAFLAIAALTGLVVAGLTHERDGFVARLRDRHARLEREFDLRGRELLSSEARFEGFMRRLPAPAWIKDLNGRFVYVNDAMARHYGLARTAVVGRTDFDLLAPSAARRSRLNDADALRAGPTPSVEPAPDGSRLWIVQRFPILGPDGRPAYLGALLVHLPTDAPLPASVPAPAEAPSPAPPPAAFAAPAAAAAVDLPETPPLPLGGAARGGATPQ